jgi:NAD(P)-dependent dehydrogenase (short-subunit alcohol dehydrogenase family)
MARIFITGSADGLGQLAAVALIKLGHKVVLHARNEKRAKDALDKTPGAEAVITADLSNIEETKNLAHKVNELGEFDCVIHNAGVYQAPAKEIFAVNTLAPYILTCLIRKPKRLIYLSSGMHKGGHFKPDDFRTAISHVTYSDSKLHVLLLCIAVARKWKNVFANALDPGWVPTKMGGRGAPDNLQKGYETQVWLATSNDPQAMVSGHYFHHKREARYNPEADDVAKQDKFISICGEITGVEFERDDYTDPPAGR